MSDLPTLGEALERLKLLEKLDAEASEYVESVIVMRTHFTGDPPYVGWKGLGLALTQALDERDAALLDLKLVKAWNSNAVTRIAELVAERDALLERGA